MERVASTAELNQRTHKNSDSNGPWSVRGAAKAKQTTTTMKTRTCVSVFDILRSGEECSRVESRRRNISATHWHKKNKQI